jgi:predicted protein tyrosine phosphatase
MIKSRPIINSYWVTEQFCAGRYPGDLDDAIRDQQVAKLEAAGLTYFVDLTEEGELKPYAMRLEMGRHVRMPIHDFSVTTEANYQETLDTIDAAIANGETVYLHCWGGIGRTGTIVGCWLVRHGMEPQAALEQISEWRNANPNRHKPSPETAQQRQVVLGWRKGL